MMRRHHNPLRFRLALAALAMSWLAGCGGSSSGEIAYESGGGTTMPPTEAPQSKSESYRFLKQASFGAKNLEAENLLHDGYLRWIEHQFTRPPSLMRPGFDRLQQLNPDSSPRADWIYELFWQNAVQGEDQLRQRVTFALSQIFVVSLRDANVSKFPRGVSEYYDVLARNAFGNYRNLLHEVTVNPMMGLYLSHLGNEKGDPETGRVPDENFAREIMQLFSIGLYELNIDGSPKLGPDGKPIETYSTEDVEGLARVFTGLSWAGPDLQRGRFRGWIKTGDREIYPMQSYPQYHSDLEKRFLGTVIPAGSRDAWADVDTAIDTLFNHPNVGPFLARQLIQRLVTSNPSPGYIQRVAEQFNDNGEGQRGDMRAVVRAILFDSEARDRAAASQPGAGKIREPILRFAHWMRAFRAHSGTGRFRVGNTDDAGRRLGQTVLRSPSVFNFYRPGYVPPNTPIADAAMVAPEMQITHETSVAGWLNMMRSVVKSGYGSNREIQPNYQIELSLANDPAELVERLNVILLDGLMSNALRIRIIEALQSRSIEHRDPAVAERYRQERVYMAVFLTMASPEFAVLK